MNDQNVILNRLKNATSRMSDVQSAYREASAIADEFRERFVPVDPSCGLQVLPVFAQSDADCAIILLRPGCELRADRTLHMSTVLFVVLEGHVLCEGQECSLRLEVSDYAEIPSQCTRGISAPKGAKILLVKRPFPISETR